MLCSRPFARALPTVGRAHDHVGAPVCMWLRRARCHAMQLRVARWSYELQIRTAFRVYQYSWPSRFPFNYHGHYNLSLFNLSIAPHNTTSTPTMTHREGMSSGAPMEFGEHRVETHAREMISRWCTPSTRPWWTTTSTPCSSCLIETSTRWSASTYSTPPVVPA